MLEHSAQTKYWVDFLHELHERGIRSLHVSSEYESFDLAAECIRMCRQQGVKFRLYVKLAEPSFDDEGFSEKRFRSKVEYYLEALGVTQLGAIQWMWRAGLQNDDSRLAAYSQASELVTQSINAEVARGSVKEVRCFPYTTAFAEQVINNPSIHGLTVYRNGLESEYDRVIEQWGLVKKNVTTIRPFGSATGKVAIDKDMAHTFALPAVDSTILTCTQQKHLQELYAYFEKD